MAGFDTAKQIKLLIHQDKTLIANINRTLNDSATEAHSRYVSFNTYANMYNNIATEAGKLLNCPFGLFPTELMPGHMDTPWGTQKAIMESAVLQAGILLTYLESVIDFAEDEFENISNFIKSKLRPTLFTKPEKEEEVQNAIEVLLIGRDLSKGIDYDRESGKFEFSGKEYIPDFILPKMNLCIEVKLLREGKRSRVIDEINADITAYSTQYERILFVIYDLGVIRDEAEFRRDIENAGANIKVIIVKH